MPGTILRDDAADYYTKRLQQHAQDAFQTLQQANQPPLQNVQVSAPSLPNPQIDPNAAVARLQQFGQDAWQAAQQANQPPLQGVQIDPNAVTQRLQQHAQDAFQAIDQNVQPVSQGLQQVAQPVQQATQAIGQGVQQGVEQLQPLNQPPLAPQQQDQGTQRGGDLRAYARDAARRAGIDPDVFERQIDQESGFNVTAKSGAGAQGIAQFMPQTAAGLGLDPSDPYASLDAAARLDAQNLSRYGGDWGKALAAYNAGPGAVDQYGGVPPFEETQRYVRNILGGAKQAAGDVLERGRAAVAGAVLPVLSQFGDKELTAAEAYAACGPAAAVRFAQMFGRNPTLREATDMASNLGWTRDTGMAGLQSESQLFTQMGIPHRVVGADWQALSREAQSGNPVTISTPGHYFTADAYDPKSGAFHVGSSGTDLRGGSEWMTAAQMEQRMGPLQGGLAADNPGTPAPSPISGPVEQAKQLVQQGGRAIQAGLQTVDQAVQGAVQGPVQGLTGRLGELTQDLPSRVQTPGDRTEPIVGGPSVPSTPAGNVLGSGFSALGTGARAAGDIAQELMPTVQASRVTTGTQRLLSEDPEYQTALASYQDAQRRMSSDPSLENQRALVSAQTQLDQTVGQVRGTINPVQASEAAWRSPQREGEETAAGLLGGAAAGLAGTGALATAGKVAALVLDPSSGVFSAAGEAPMFVQALAKLIQPGTPAREVADSLKVVENSTATAPQIADVIDQVQKMPGTAELAPVRAQVQQSSTDLLQAMLDAARAKGADPERLSALEQQITQMDPMAATRRALAPAGDVTTQAPGAVRDFLTSESGAVPLTPAVTRGASTIGGAVAGGVAGNALTPEDADFRDRARNVIAGAGIGAGLGSAAGFASTGPLEQRVLENLRSAGLGPSSRIPPPPPPNSPLRQQWLTGTGPWAPAATRGPIAQAVDFTKQSILSNPATHIANVIGNTIELARQPIALAAGGRGDDALAGLIAVGGGLREAAGNATAALRGTQLPTLAGPGDTIPARSPIFRMLSASDAFTRTLAEYQGMAAEANRLLRDAGMAASDPAAADFLASHAKDLYAQGSRAGAQSVFGRVASAASGNSVLENIFKGYANAKEGFLASPRLRDQALGALMDFGIPFSGVPVQMLQIGMNRLPVAAQASGAIRAVRALKAGNLGEAQRAVGETGLETALQLMIAKQVSDGNITGPDDPDHPNSVRVGGNWVSMNEWGAYALPMQIMASFADGFEKGGHDVPPSTPGASPLEQYQNYYGPRFAAALNASLKPFQQGIPGENILRFISNVGQGGFIGGATGLAQDIVNRIFVPGAARFAENLTDPVAREINRKGIESLWQGPQSNIPGLAQLLPARIDPTTGEPLAKARTGIGILVGGQQDVESPLSVEANRLKKAGFDVNPPKVYPDTVSVAGADVHLSPDEQRKVTQITGKMLGGLADRLTQPDYLNSTPERKAQLMQAYLNAAEKARVSAVRDVIGADELRSRVITGQKTVGRLNVQAPPPQFTAPFLSSSSQSAQEQQAVGAGR